MQRLGSLFKNHPLYSDFIQVKSRLARHQFICWVAGGAVRDLYLGRKVDDFDLVTDASTETLKQIFPEAILVGESFGVIKIPVSNAELFDLATFRQESDYVDGRRPSAVSASTAIEDAKRRDFTINALFWDDENQQLIDLVGGVADLNHRQLRTVGDAYVRFEEDHLRIIRLIRFAAQLNFAIEPSTEQAAQAFISKIQKVSGERIWTELKKIAHARNWQVVLNSELFQNFMREIFGSGLPENFLAKHNISVIEGFELESFYFLLMNLEADQQPIKKILSQRLKLSKTELAIYEALHFSIHHLVGKSAYEVCLQVERKSELKSILKFLVQLNFLSAVFVEQIEKLLVEHPVAVLSGHDLVSMLKGPDIGEALDEIRILQLQGKITSRDEALSLARARAATKKSP